MQRHDNDAIYHYHLKVLVWMCLNDEDITQNAFKHPHIPEQMWATVKSILVNVWKFKCVQVLFNAQMSLNIV